MTLQVDRKQELRQQRARMIKMLARLRPTSRLRPLAEQQLFNIELELYGLGWHTADEDQGGASVRAEPAYG